MEFSIKTSKREEILDITEKVREIVKKSSEGNENYKKVCLVYVPHATCGIIVNENYDPSVREDIIDALREMFPKGKWKHDKIDDNGDAHLKASLVGPSQIIPIKRGNLQLGTWQSIGLAEFDGPKKRKVIVNVL